MRQKTQDMLQALIPNEQKRKVPTDIWARMDASQRIEELTGHSLDNCRDILDMPIEVAVKSPTVINGKAGIIRAILAGGGQGRHSNRAACGRRRKRCSRN